MNNNPMVMTVGVAIVALIAGGGAGYAYKAHADSPAKLQSLGNPVNTSGVGMAGGLMGKGGTRGGRGNNGTIGQIISKDSTSITVKDVTGSTKVVYVGASTTISNSVQGSVTDLVIGKSVNVTGSSNSDGSVTAINVQMRALAFPSPVAM